MTSRNILQRSTGRSLRRCGHGQVRHGQVVCAKPHPSSRVMCTERHNSTEMVFRSKECLIYRVDLNEDCVFRFISVFSRNFGISRFFPTGKYRRKLKNTPRKDRPYVQKQYIMRLCPERLPPIASDAYRLDSGSTQNVHWASTDLKRVACRQCLSLCLVPRPVSISRST